MTIYIENAVKGFSRYHKYTLGTDLRDISRTVVRLIVRANSERKRLATLVHLRDTIEELKVTVRVCKEVKAFKNLALSHNEWVIILTTKNTKVTKIY